jgi:hypothetical protein
MIQFCKTAHPRLQPVSFNDEGALVTYSPDRIAIVVQGDSAFSDATVGSDQ